MYPRKDVAKLETEEMLAELNKQLPWSDDAERGFLSCLIQYPERITEVRTAITPDVFYHVANRIVYEIMLALEAKSLAVDIVTVSNALDEQGTLDKVGGRGAISEIFTFIPADAHFEFYQKILVDKWLVRQGLRHCAQSILELQQYGAEDVNQDVRPLFQAMEERAFSLVQKTEEVGTGDDGPVASVVVVDECLAHVQTVMKAAGEIPSGRITTGFPDFDRACKGLEEGDKFIIGARPKMGKTIVLCSMFKHIAVDCRVPTLVFSLEMKRRRFLNRVMFGGFGIETSKADTGFLSEGDQQNLAIATGQLSASPFWIDDDPGLTTADFRSRVRIAKRKNGIRVVMLDYIQMLNPVSAQGMKEERLQIKEAMSTLHTVAKDEGVVIIALAQASREAENNAGSEPKAKDFDGGSAIEKYVDYGAFIHRPAFYKPWDQIKEDVQQKFRNRFQKMRAAMPQQFAPDRQVRNGMNEPVFDLSNCPVMEWDIATDWKEHAQLLLCLNRNGGPGRIDLRFQGEFTRFLPRNPHLYSNNAGKRQQEHSFQ